MLTEAELIHRLGGSTVYQDFERAFCEVTQFSLRLLPIQNQSSACNGEWNGHQCSSTTDVPVRIGVSNSTSRTGTVPRTYSQGSAQG
jgi:hypothetical protein